MGIPKFYRWLSQRYPLINQSISHIIPEYDNLYLDFNGVIHRCTHPDDINPLENALTESDMIIKMFEYVQLLVSMIKPKKVLVIAVDGVAPRAKMNQQRSRRFRTAKDTAEAVSKAQKAGAHVPDHLFDSNCITPGTEFMQKLNDHFAYFIKKKISEDPLWKNLLVVFSGHDTPGEGEHKIMDFIRKMKSRDGYDPNTTHCMYGLDADLIMLSLVTHEPHFTLLRENVYKKWERPNKFKAPKAPTSNSNAPENDFQLLHISLLREYLNEEFRLASTDDFHYDLERIIDDFVFICYFIGNDFLPNLPFLDIANNSLDQIFDTYKTCLKETHQYLTLRGHLDLDRCEDFIARISRIEQESLNFGGTHKFTDEAFGFLVDDQPTPSGDEGLNLPAENTPVIHHHPSRKHQPAPHGKESSQSESESGPDTDAPAEADSGEPAPRKSRKTQELEQRLASLGFVGHPENHGFEEIHDDNAWKDQYYLLKFNHSITEQDFHRQLQFEYLRGLCWVLKYYYDGCASWGWFYPYHYAPLASDLTRLNQHQNLDQFELGAPFLPFQQLLSVLPRASKTLLPFAYQALMTNADSPIYEFYPTDFKVDINGKKNDWEGVVLIPFIDEALLRKACDTITPEQLTEGERSRNINSEYHLLFKYNESLDLTVPNTLPEVPALYHNRTELQRLILPTHLIEFKLCEGVQTGINGPPGFPTFYSLPYRSEHKIVGVTVFSFPSKAESLVIHLLRPPLWESEFSEYPPEMDIIPQENVTEAELDAMQMDQEIHSLRTSQQLQDKAKQITQQLADKYLGKKIFTYPYHTECRVAEVSCEYITLKSRDETHIQDRHTWFKTKKEVALRFLFKQAVEVGDIQVLFKLEPIQGMRLLPTGQKQKLFDPEKTEWYPFQAVVEHVKQPDHRYDETEVPIEKIVPLETLAIITEPKYFGAKALVRGFVEPNTSSKKPRRHAGIKLSNKLIKVEFAPIPVPPTFAKENYLTVHYEYFTVDEVARRLHISKDVISQITSSVFIIPRTDIGLRLKFSQRSQKVAGYSNRNRGWEFTERAIAMIADYYAKFPQVFKALEHRKFDDKLRVDEIFHENSRNNLRALTEYLNSLHLNSLPVVPLNYSHMSEEAIRKTEIELEEYLKNLETGPKMKTLARDMDISQLQIPVSDLFHVQGRAAFHVGDQICYIRDGFGPPFGSYGFVTAVDRHSGYINAMFEHEFIGGTTFHGVLNKARGLEFIEPRYALCITAISDWYRYSKSSRDNVQHTISLEQFLRDRHEDRPYRKSRDSSPNQSGGAGGSGNGNGNPSLRNSYNGRQRASGTPNSPMRGDSSKSNDRPNNKESRQKFDQDSDKPAKQPRNQKQQQQKQKHPKQKNLERVEASTPVSSPPAPHVVANVELSVPAPVAKVDQPQPVATGVPQAIPLAQVNVPTKLSAIEAPLLASVNITAKPSVVPAGPSSDEINALGFELLATLQPGAQNAAPAVEASESPRVAKAEGGASPAVPAASGESNPIEKLFYSGPPKPTSQPKLNPNPQQILLQPWLKNQTTLPNAAFDPRAAQAYYSGMPIGSHTPPQWNDPNFRPPPPTSVPFPQPPPGAFPFPVAQYPGQIPGQVPLGFVPVPGGVAPRSGSNPGFLIPSQIVAGAPGQANPQNAPGAPVPGAPGPGPVVQEQSQDLNWQQKHLMSRTDLPEQAQLDSQLSKRRDPHPRGEKKNRGKHHPRGGGDHHRERNDHN